MGTAEGREDMKPTGGMEGTGATGMGTGAVKGWEAGTGAMKGWEAGTGAAKGWEAAAAMIGLGCGARTDLVTSSNHRSASDGVRLWEGMAGDDVGGTTITGVGDDQLLPADGKTQKRVNRLKINI